MATAENTSIAEAYNQVVGKVVILYGNVKAISIDGTERVLGPNSPVFAYDRIVSESDGRVSIVMDDGAHSQLDIGRMSDIIIDEDTFAGISEEDIAASVAQVQQIQEALLAEGFDPTVELEAPAAGGFPPAGGGHPVPDFVRVTHEGEITSGAETTGITGDTVGTIPGSVEVLETGNNQPLAGDDTPSTDEDTSVDINVLANDTDVDGDSLTITGVSDPAHGTAVINPDGTIKYTPDANYNGTDSFTYTVSDGQGGTDTATVTVSVNPVNDAPVAVDDSASTNEDSSINIDVLANDHDVDGDTLTVDSFTQPEHGTVTQNPDGTLNYAPAADYNGSDSFTYTVSDGNGGTDTATVSLTVDPVNDAPVAVDDSASTNEDNSINIDVLANDTDLDGDTLTVDSFTQPEHGTVTQNPDGTLNYAPAADYNGSDGFTYTVSDGNGGTDTATVTVTVNPVDDANDPPVAVDDTPSTDEDTSVDINVLANDTDLDGDTLTVDSFTQPGNGTVTENSDGTLKYTPDADYNGTDSFTYTVSDGNGGTDTATVTVTVNPDNDPPVAVDDTPSTDEDTSVDINVLANDTDLDGDTLTVDSFTQPGNGTVTENSDGTLKYTPDADYNGTDSFTYTVSDGNGGTDTATVTVTVNPDNDPPVAVDDTPSTDEDTSVDINVLANDTDLDGDTLTVDSFTQPGNGTVTENSDGTLKYTPDADYNGTDSFTYTVSDGNGGTDTATVTVTVNPDNDPPVAVDDTPSTDEDTSVDINVLANDTDLDGDTLTVDSFTQPGNGTVTENSDGTLKYTPDADYNGTDSFTYTVSDGNGGTDTATVTVTVNPDNDPPVAVDDTPSTDEDTSVDINVLANDTDLDGDTLTVDSFTQPGNGTVTENSDGTLKYTPDADYNGTDSFTYTVSDGNGGTDTATVTVTVNPDNDPPVAVDDTPSTDEDTSVDINVLANDTDLDGDTLTVDSFTQPGNGTVTENSDGTLKYTPDADYNGTDSFTYTVSDGNGGTDTATVTVTVNPDNDPPVAVDDTPSTDEDTSVDINVLANDTDLDGDTLTVDSFTQPGNGTVTENSDGTLKYTPDADYNGTDSFTYTVSDGNGGTDTATVTVTVNPDNDPPVAVDDTPSTDEDTSVDINVLANDTDLDGDTLTVDSFTQPGNGTVTENSDGTLKYTPDADYNGTDSFTYTVSDGNGGTDTATVTVTVNPDNDPPVAVDDTPSTDEDTSVDINVLANDTDLDGDTLTVDSFTQPGNGTVTENSDGTLKYTPDADYNGTDSFTYTVSDGNGGTDTATVTVTVNPDNDPPVVGNATATVSEEGLPDGIPDGDGTSDTTDSDFDSSALSGQTISVTDTDSVDTHTFTLSEAITDPVTGNPMTLSSNGLIIDWQVDPGTGKTLVGTAGVGGDPVITITINDSGQYTVDLDGPIDHPDTTAEDVITFNVAVNVSDGTDISSGTLTVNVEDDSPSIVANYDAILANEPGNGLTVPLEIDFGADSPNATTPIQLNGPTLFGYVVDNHGNFLTSDGERLVYESDGNGGLIAVKNGTSTQIFSVAVDSVAETYTVTILGPLDGAAGVVFDLNTGGIDPGIGDEVLFYGGENGNLQIRITGYDNNGDPAEVNSSTPGMGVDNNWLDHKVGENSEQLFMVFSDTSSSDPHAMTAAEITANSMGVGEEAVWKVYDTNGYTAEEFKLDPSLWNLVNEGTAPGSASSHSTFIIEGGLDPVTDQPYTFDAIVLEAGDGDSFRVFDVTSFTSDSGANTTISYYNGAGVMVFDADGDNNHTIPTFDVTFDADGNITGTSSHEIISGSSSSDLLFGGNGDDFISGGAGNDMLDGGAGNDHLTGGAGADNFKAGVGDDHITDYNQADGDVVDISAVFDAGAGDHLGVSENLDDGTARLSIFDSGDVEQGSITFDNIDFADLAPDPGVDLNGDGDMNQLDSLLGQVDIDDGSIG